MTVTVRQLFRRRFSLFAIPLVWPTSLLFRQPFFVDNCERTYVVWAPHFMFNTLIVHIHFVCHPKIALTMHSFKPHINMQMAPLVKNLGNSASKYSQRV